MILFKKRGDIDMKLKEGFIICDTKTKKKILSSLKELKNYIFLSYNELLKKYYGSCKKESLFYLMDQYQISYDLAMEYMKYIPYVQKMSYNNKKLDSIVSLRSYLEKLGLFEKDNLFLYRLKQFPITFITKKCTMEFKRITEDLSKITEVILYKEETLNNKPIVYQYKDILDEAYDVFHMMKEYHKKGISYNNMYILNMTSDYEYIFKRLSKNYNIPIKFKENKNILHTKFAKDLLALLEEKETFQEVIDHLIDSEFLSPLMDLIKEYSLEDKKPKDYIDFFRRKLSEFSYKADLYKEMVNVSDSIHFNDDEYVFYLGLNQGISPKIYKDLDYLSDELKEILSIPTSVELNKEEREDLIYFIENTKNIHLSFSIRRGTVDLFPSGIISQLGLKIENRYPSYGYSKEEDKLRFGVLLSIYDKTHEVDSALENYDLSDVSYLTFDNSYKGINKSLMENRYEDEASLSFSYSTMKYYFECPFHYYLEKVLDLASYDQTISTRLGSYSHKMLEDSYTEKFDFDSFAKKNQEEFLSGIEAEEYQKEKFYFHQMNEVLEELIRYNHNHENLSSLDHVLREEHISYIEGNLKFHGYIDKLLYTELYGEVYAAIMDYKTGKDIVSLDNVSDGFNLQLPSYMYLLSKHDKFKGKRIHIIGIYLQKVNMIALDNSIDILSQREKSFRLQGFTINDPSLILKLDPGFNKSDYIQSMMTLKDGSFGKYSKIITKDEEDELILKMDELIHKAKDGVMNADFKIAPKLINNKDKSCSFCKYKDICFKKYNDYVELEEKKFKKEER